MANICKIINNIIYSFGVFALLIAFSSCKSSNGKISDATLESFAALQCKAINLKTQRFELSAELRKEESNTPIDTASISYIKRKADSLKIQSLDLADIIKVKLDSIFETIQEDDMAKENFNALLKEKLTSMGCSDK